MTASHKTGLMNDRAVAYYSRKHIGVTVQRLNDCIKLYTGDVKGRRTNVYIAQIVNVLYIMRR